MTGYVVTRYYRAPEIMLTWRRYDEKVDIWSAACIFAEMMIGRPLFPGKNHIDQFSVITQLLGMPPDEVISQITSEKVSITYFYLPYLICDRLFIRFIDTEVCPLASKAKSQTLIIFLPKGWS